MGTDPLISNGIVLHVIALSFVLMLSALDSEKHDKKKELIQTKHITQAIDFIIFTFTLTIAV